MVWDRIAGCYDLVELVYNGTVYKGVGRQVAEEIESEDVVLECACGTGMISRQIAPKCRRLIATDCSAGMLRQAQRHCRKYPNVQVRWADMTQLHCRQDCFDKVVAGNVIHLLEDPQQAVRELVRVCKPGGKIIIPTYINLEKRSNARVIRLLELAGIRFPPQFDLASYQQFFADAGYEKIRYEIIEGRMPCAVAILTKG